MKSLVTRAGAGWLALVAATTSVPLSWGQAPAAPPQIPIKQLMETTITDASNVIWAAYEAPNSDEQWTALEQAARALIDATKATASGGTGPKDNEWVKEPAWAPFNAAMLAASEAALAAIRAKNHEALLAASDALYPPCEGCHLLFNPGVVNQN
jgi:cytochrome c556